MAYRQPYLPPIGAAAAAATREAHVQDNLAAEQTRQRKLASLRAVASRLQQNGVMQGRLPTLPDQMGNHDIEASARQMGISFDQNGNPVHPGPNKSPVPPGALAGLPGPQPVMNQTPAGTTTPAAKRLADAKAIRAKQAAGTITDDEARADLQPDYQKGATVLAGKDSPERKAVAAASAPPADPFAQIGKPVFTPGTGWEARMPDDSRTPGGSRIVGTTVPAEQEMARKFPGWEGGGHQISSDGVDLTRRAILQHATAPRIAIEGSPNDPVTSGAATQNYNGEIIAAKGPLAGQQVGYDPTQDRTDTMGHDAQGRINSRVGKYGTGTSTYVAHLPPPAPVAVAPPAPATPTLPPVNGMGDAKVADLPQGSQAGVTSGVAPPAPPSQPTAVTGASNPAGPIGTAYQTAPRPGTPMPPTSAIASGAAAPSQAAIQPSPAMQAGQGVTAGIGDAIKSNAAGAVGVMDATSGAAQGAVNSGVDFVKGVTGLGSQTATPAPTPLSSAVASTVAPVVPGGSAAAAPTNPLPMQHLFTGLPAPAPADNVPEWMKKPAYTGF